MGATMKICDVCAYTRRTTLKNCPSCGNPFPKPGQISSHTGELVPGGKLYILSVRMTKNEPHIWDQRFAFHASDDSDAKSKANGWARYQGMTTNEVGVTPVAKEADLPYTQGFIHDDWIARGR